MSSSSTYPAFDREQFEQLFRSHFNYLCNYALQYVEGMDTAQEICQKVFISLWENRANIDPQQSVKSYLFTAVRNRCLNYIRDNKKYRSQILDLDCGDFDLVGEEDHFAERELQQRIEEALRELPPKCRQVFEMSRFQAMKYREIAEELGVSQKTVEAHMSKAMKHLRERLQDYFFLFLLFMEHLK